MSKRRHRRRRSRPEVVVTPPEAEKTEAPTALALADDPTIKSLTAKLAANPDDGGALYRRGQVYASKGAYSLAIKDFDCSPATSFAIGGRGTSPRSGQTGGSRLAGGVIGYASAHREGGVANLADESRVHPEARGLGIGSHLLDEAEEWARENNLPVSTCTWSTRAAGSWP